MLKLFIIYVMQAASFLGVRIDGVEVNNLYCQGTEACVASCELQGFMCDNIVLITESSLMNSDQKHLRYLAVHEVCHLKNGDQFVWSKVNDKTKKELHKQIKACVKDTIWRMGK